MAEQVSSEDIESLAEKLEVFAASLPDGERDLLAQVLETAAASSGDDTSGFAAYVSPTSWSVAQIVGTSAVQVGIADSYFPKGSPTSRRKE